MSELVEAEVIRRVRAKHQGRIVLVKYAGTSSAKSLFRHSVCGHEWEALANNVIRGSGCPECGGNRRLREEDVRRRIAARHEEHVVLLTYGGSVSAKSLFRCDRGHEWRAKADHVMRVSGCPQCFDARRGHEQRVSEAEARQRISTEHSGRILMSMYAGSAMAKSRFRCTVCEHEWETTADSVGRGRGCANCSGKARLTEADVRQRIKAKHEERIALVVYGGGVAEQSGFRCSSGHEWATQASHVMTGTGCPTCHYDLVAKVYSLSDEKAREAALEYAGFEPYEHEPYVNARTPWRGLCTDCGIAEIAPTLTNLKKRHRARCSDCANAANADAMRLPELDARRLAKEHADFEPFADEPYVNADTPWPGLCPMCGVNVVSPSLSSLVNGSTSCRPCSHIKRAAKRTTPDAAARAEAAERGFLPDPGVPFPGVDEPWTGECLTCHNRIAPSLTNMRRGQGPCEFCARAVRAEKLRKPHAEALAIAIGSGYTPDPSIPYPGANTPWPGICHKAGHRAAPRLTSLLKGGGPCATCAERGLDPAAPSVVYVVTSDALDAIKVGISNTDSLSGRLRAHRQQSFETVVRVRHYSTGTEARAVEQRIVRSWREQGAPVAATPADMPRGGWTETAPLSIISVGAALDALHALSVARSAGALSVPPFA